MIVQSSATRIKEPEKSTQAQATKGEMGLNSYVTEIGLEVGLLPDISGSTMISRGVQPHDWADWNYNQILLGCSQSGFYI
jgi:hypothetical protein